MKPEEDRLARWFHLVRKPPFRHMVGDPDYVTCLWLHRRIPHKIIPKIKEDCVFIIFAATCPILLIFIDAND